MKKLFASLLLLLIATPVFAQTSVRDYPALSLARLTVGGRVEHVWWEGKDFAPRTQFNVKKKIDAKVAEWKIAYGDKIPDVEVEAFLAEYASVEELKRIFREAAPEFVNLYKTGRSKFTRDPSAL